MSTAPVRWAQQGYVLAYNGHDGYQRLETWNLHGVPWNKAPRPRRFHLCTPQTMSIIEWFTFMHQCACGATWHSATRRWRSKNARLRGELPPW